MPYIPPAVLQIKAEFEQLKAAQVKQKWDWPAIFSANQARQVWPYVTPGLTPESQRVHLQGSFQLLDRLVVQFLRFRDEGGRFWVDEKGAYLDSTRSAGAKFAEFAFADE